MLVSHLLISPGMERGETLVGLGGGDLLICGAIWLKGNGWGVPAVPAMSLAQDRLGAHVSIHR